MSTLVIIDADFLSAFLKIGQLDLVRNFYQVDQIHLAPAVYREVAQTTLLTQLVEVAWFTFVSPNPKQLTTLQQDELFNRLGAGEQASIAWALEQDDTILLTNDNQARRIALSLGAIVVNIPAFLLACKLSGQLTRNEIQQVIDDLWRLDHYRFRQDVQARLLD